MGTLIPLSKLKDHKYDTNIKYFFSDGESTTVMLTLSMAIGKRTADID